ncbi:hypothetical protein L6164_028195 [Bauhinia variegata]|uniref:Uncharacterized protein n=1 Tax=Bauhinia variegata TaxID=167791 RepID=A0ACB9LWV0_BAUVA|nr:hypothetical protein L6164_028195 [Bauhinia variegata]
MAFTGNLRIYLIIFVALLEISYVHGRNFSDAELEQLLKILNKPYLESFKIGDGEIIDCVNIYEQPSLSHPLLKGHKIKMKPSFVPKMEHDPDKYPEKAKQVDFLSQRRACPMGTVPIRRTTKKDLITSQILMKSLRKPIDNKAGVETSAVGMKGIQYNGVYAGMNIHNPNTADKLEFSKTAMWLASGDEILAVGWIVLEELLGDNKTRFFTSWTVDGGQQTGCYNTFCRGFIQVHPSVHPGIPFNNISVIGGDQWEAKFLIFRDRYTGDWWVVAGGTYERIGYWPKSLFGSLAESGGTIVAWGGQVGTLTDVDPPMGSGHYAEEGFGKAAFIRSLQFLDDQYSHIHANWDQLPQVKTCPKYYTLDKYQSDAIFYGGPSGSC